MRTTGITGDLFEDAPPIEHRPVRKNKIHTTTAMSDMDACAQTTKLLVWCRDLRLKTKVNATEHHVLTTLALMARSSVTHGMVARTGIHSLVQRTGHSEARISKTIKELQAKGLLATKTGQSEVVCRFDAAAFAQLVDTTPALTTLTLEIIKDELPPSQEAVDEEEAKKQQQTRARLTQALELVQAIHDHPEEAGAYRYDLHSLCLKCPELSFLDPRIRACLIEDTKQNPDTPDGQNGMS